jgi:hypothetical protein
MNTEHPRWFNTFVCADYWHNATLIAYRFFDLGLEDWDKRACEWHMRYGYGVKISDGDSYFSGNQQRRYSVDKLAAENPLQMSDTAQVMYNCWLMEKARREASKKPPPIPTAPKPAPEPKPEPKPEPEPEPKPEPKPRKPINLKLIVAILGAVAFALKFTPVPALVLAGLDIVIKILNAM